MPTEYILFLLIFPSLLAGCCGSPRKTTAHQQDTPPLHYRAVEGELFMMPCIKSSNRHLETVWSRTGEGKEKKDTGASYSCWDAFLAEAKHSGKYTDITGGRKLIFRVVKKPSVGCFQPEGKNRVIVPLAAGGKLTCPDLTCSNNTDVIWYKGNKTRCCPEKGVLRLRHVDKDHEGVYFCDRRIHEGSITWTIRRAVNVIVGPRGPPTYPPRITDPDGNGTEEVELGLPHNLTCKVFFPFEIEFSPKVLWYMNYNGNIKKMTLLHLEKPQQSREIHDEIKIIQTAIIKEVTAHHLNHTYTCSTANIVGNSSVTIKLKRRIKVKWPSLVGYPIVSFLVVAMLGGILHLTRIELQLIYRSYFQFGKHETDKKRFDVFLSYVRSPALAEVSESLTLSSRSGSSNDEEACHSITDLLNMDEGEAKHRLLEVLLPQVLEDQWGYRLCLLDRDPLPGGVYTNDVVLAIERSRILICVLSADYLTNSNAVFELETGIQALLQKSTPKLLLIWTSGASGSLKQADPPLPTLVQKALRVLPSLKWNSSRPARAKSNFWRSLRKAMPHQRC